MQKKLEYPPPGGRVSVPPAPPPKKNHKNIGFLSGTGPDPLKNDKATKQAFDVGSSSALQRNAIFLDPRMYTTAESYLRLLQRIG